MYFFGTAMKQSIQDKVFMRKAYALAQKGKAKVHPNPMVGCVIVKNNRIVGKGYHEVFGGPHAEINALQNAQKNACGATMYVTLEPCAHTGKTPACAYTVARSGIKRVVIGLKYPNPCTCGKGIRILKERGVSVSHGVLRDKVYELNRDFARKMKQKKRSVLLKMAMSLDGKIATRTGDSRRK